MAKRFGRNQKRKMRAEIAERDAEIGRLGYDLKFSQMRGKDLADKLNRLSRDVNLWDSRIRDLLGSDSSFAIEIRAKLADHLGIKRERYPVRQETMLSPIAPFELADAQSITKIITERLYKFKVFYDEYMDKGFEDLRRVVEWRELDNQVDACIYTMSQSRYELGQMTHDIEEHLARECAKSIVRYAKEKYRKGKTHAKGY